MDQQNQNQGPTPNEAQNPQTETVSGSSDGAHLDALIERLEAEQNSADAAVSGTTGAASARLTQDQFFAAFRAVIQGGNVVIKPPLESLIVAESDAGARAASDAIYDTCLDIPLLHWLIEPGNVWMQRALVVSAFGFALSSSIRGELAARKSQRGQRRRQNGNGHRTPSDMTGAAQRAETAQERPIVNEVHAVENTGQGDPAPAPVAEEVT